MNRTLALFVFTFSLFISFVISEDIVYLPAAQFGGFDVIFSNDTSYLDEIDSHGEIMYVSGNGVVREVLENPFSLEYNPRFFNQQHRFIDFKAFNDVNNKTWVLGPIPAHHVAGSIGLSHPFQLASMDSSYTQDFSEVGVLYSSLIVHTTAVNTHLAYVAGWALQGSAVNFVITRLTVNPETGSNNNFFSAEPSVALNYTSGYEDFYRTYKPKLFRNGDKSYVIVVDPSSRCVYKISTSGDDTASPSAISFLGSVHVPFYGSFGGVTYDRQKEIVYVALVAQGTNAGSILSISTASDSPSIVNQMTLSQYQSNPTSLHFKDGMLYVGFNGGHAIMRIDIYNSDPFYKYSTVPYYLRSVSAVHARRGNLYFVTYDQFAKVAKIDEQHFCVYMCDSHYGYCANSECQCLNGTTLDIDGHTCNINKQIETNIVKESSHAGEVALGLLFAVTLITAVIGWFLLWKTRRHGGFSNSRSGYSAASNEERDSFLGDEDH